jgi:parvulin-like peptidyl-prolyl isomerase
LNSLVERHLILDAYGKQEQKLPEWTIDARVNEIIHDSFNDDRGDLMTALSKGKVTFEEWKSQVKDHIIVSAMRGDRIERHTRVSPQAVREAYDKNRDQYRTSDQVRLRMIVLKKGTSSDTAGEKRKQADDIQKRLQAGEDFASLAKTVSEDGKAESGGDWGWIEPRKLRTELAKALADLKPAEISGVIETKDELYILKIEERKLGAVPSFEEVQSKIERDLRQEEAKVLYNAWIEALKKTAYVKVFDVSPYVEPFLK